MPGLNDIVQIVQQVASSGLDWVSNPWKGGPLFLSTWNAPYELRELTVSWSRTPTVGAAQDFDMCTFHFLNLTGGNPDATWTTADYTSVESAFDAFWTTQKTWYKGETKLAEYRWRAAGPAFKPHGASLAPTLRITARSVAGTASTGDMLPPQDAMSVTEVTDQTFLAYGVGVPGHVPGTGRTQQRNRWGRFYLPATALASVIDGRFDPTLCTSTSAAVKTMYNACVTAQLIPVVYSPTTGSAFSVIEVHVDDIVDVIRRRRYVTPMTRAVNTINPP